MLWIANCNFKSDVDYSSNSNSDSDSSSVVYSQHGGTSNHEVVIVIVS